MSSIFSTFSTFSITKNGKALDTALYTWDEESKTLATTETGLVLDFSRYHNCTFNTGYNCTFKTGMNCTFDTGSNCTFDTSYGCTFDTGQNSVVIRRDIFQVITLTEDSNLIRTKASTEAGYYTADEVVLQELIK